MNVKQQNLFNISLWPAACRAQGWKPSDRNLKLQVIGKIVGHPISTTKEVGEDGEFSRVKRDLLKLATPAAPAPAPAVRAGRGMLSEAAQAMLETLFTRAVQTHCRIHALDRISDTAVEELRQEWLQAALGTGAHDWKYLRNAEIDRLKPFLIWQADPDNETKRAAVATAAVDGQTRVVIAAILAKVLCLRQVAAWLDRQFEDVDLSPESLDDYVHSISTDTRAHANWRGLLLPILEEVLVTVEERRREHVRLLKLMYGEEEAKGLLKLLETYPDQYAAITTKYVASVEPYRTLAFAREKRAAVRAEARKRKAAPSAPARLSAYLKPTATPDSRHETQDLPANADDVPFTNQF